MPDHRILQPKLLFFKSRQEVHVRVRAVLFGVDDCVKSGMFGCECLGMRLVHRSISFRWLTRDNPVNRSRNDRFVASISHVPAREGGGSPLTGERVTANRASCKMVA